MKPVDLTDLIRKELDLGHCDGLKPKQIVELANAKLGRALLGGDKTVKNECSACRKAIRTLPPRFWDPEINVSKGAATPASLVAWLSAKPASAGGFAGVVACSIVNAKSADTRTMVISGSCTIDGSSILRGQGQFSSLDHEATEFSKFFRNERTAEKIGDEAFHVVDRLQPDKGQTIMHTKSTKGRARAVGLLTPKWMVIGIYAFTNGPDEAETLALLEALRTEAFSVKPVVAATAVVAPATAPTATIAAPTSTP